MPNVICKLNTSGSAPMVKKIPPRQFLRARTKRQLYDSHPYDHQQSTTNHFSNPIVSKPTGNRPTFERYNSAPTSASFAAQPTASRDVRTSQPQTFRFNSSLLIPFISLLIQCPRFNNPAAGSQDWGDPDLHRNNLPDFLRIRQSPLRSPKNSLLVHPPIQGSHANDACHCSNPSTKLNFARILLPSTDFQPLTVRMFDLPARAIAHPFRHAEWHVQILHIPLLPPFRILKSIATNLHPL